MALKACIARRAAVVAGCRYRAAAAGLVLLVCMARASGQIATLQVGTATVRPGETDATIPISLAVIPEAAGGQPIRELWVTIGYDPNVLGEVVLEASRPTTFVALRDQSLFVRTGTVGMNVIFRDPIQASDSVEVARLHFCVRSSAAEGTYPLKIIDGRSESGNDPFGRTRVVSIFKQEEAPREKEGAAVVAGEVVPDAACPADRHDEPFPVAIAGSMRLDEASGKRGEEVRVPLFLKADSEILAFQLSIDFDEEALSFVGLERVFKLPNGTTDYGFVRLRFDNSNEVPGNSGIEEGALVAAVIFSLEGPPLVLPRNVEHEVVRLRFRISPNTEKSSAVVRFMDGAQFGGPGPATNFVSVFSPPNYDVVAAALSPTFVAIHSAVEILGDVTVFIRGDSNADDAVNVSDVHASLGYLFQQGAAPRCLDAADANDDGRVDLGDPVTTLFFLFLGGVEIPPPFSQPGLDPSEDLLQCL